MWIEEIFIENFGAVRNLRVTGLSPGLNVILGPNEAGKSTLMEFIRSVFFGFKKKVSRGNIYETPDGVPRKGRIEIRTAQNERLRIQRSEQWGLKEGVLAVSDESGRNVAPSSIAVFRAGLDRNAYENLFAFDLDLVRRLDHETLRGKIVATSLGSLQVNPLEVMRRIDDRLKKLVKRTATGDESLLWVQSHIREADKQLRVLAEKPLRYSQRKGELEAVRVKRREISSNIAEKEGLLHQLSKILRYEEDWNKLVADRRESSELEDATHFPADGVDRLEREGDRRCEAGESAQELERSIEDLREQQERLNPDIVLLDSADAIRSLSRQARDMTGRVAEMRRLTEDLARSETSLEEEISTLGAGWHRDRVAAFDPSLSLEESVRLHIRDWQGCLDKMNDLRPRVFEAEETCRRHQTRIAGKKDELGRIIPLCAGHLDPESQRMLQEWRFHQRRISELRERLSEKEARVRELMWEREELDTSLEKLESGIPATVPALLFWIAVVLIGLGAGALLYAVTIADVPSYPRIFMGVSLALGVPIIVRWRLRRERRAAALNDEKRVMEEKRERKTGEVASVEHERRGMIQQIHRIQAEMERITSAVLGDPRGGEKDIVVAEISSAKAEGPTRRRRALEDAVKSDLTDLEVERDRCNHIKRLMDEAAEDLDRHKSEWALLMNEDGIDDEIGPETALTLILRLRDLKKQLRRISEERETLSAVQREWNDFSERVRALGQAMGRSPDPDLSPVDQVERWVNAEREAREILAEKKAFLARIREQKIQLDVTEKRMKDADDRIAALMEAAGVPNEEDFRELSRRHDRYCQLRQEEQLLVSGLMSGLGFKDDVVMLEHFQAQDWNENRNAEAALQAALVVLRAEAEELATREGRLAQEIEALEKEDDTEKLLAEREVLISRFNKLAKEWFTTKLASRLLEKTLRIYESEKQPKVLERGSGFLSSITCGMFSNVLFPLDEDRIKVERHDGSRIDQELLSRGTLEQVYLSLRLAYLDVYHRDESIPLIMDEILVNFDPERSGRAAETLARFSEETGCQILFFTCHPHIARSFPDTVAKVDLEYYFENNVGPSVIGPFPVP